MLLIPIVKLTKYYKHQIERSISDIYRVRMTHGPSLYNVVGGPAAS